MKPAPTLSKQGDQNLKRLVSDDIATLHHMVAHLPSEIAIFAVIPLVSIVLLIALVGPMAFGYYYLVQRFTLLFNYCPTCIKTG